MASRKRNLNVNEVLSMLEEDGYFQNANVYIEPPNVNEDTDEDSWDEDEGGDVSNLKGHQLAASASATVFRDGQRQQLTTTSEVSHQSPDTSNSEAADEATHSDNSSDRSIDAQPSESNYTTGKATGK